MASFKKTISIILLFLTAASCTTLSTAKQAKLDAPSRKLAANSNLNTMNNIHCSIKVQDPKEKDISFGEMVFDRNIFTNNDQNQAFFLIQYGKLVHVGRGESSRTRPEELSYIKTRNNEAVSYVELKLEQDRQLLTVTHGLFDMMKYKTTKVRTKSLGSVNSVVSVIDYEGLLLTTCFPVN